MSNVIRRKANRSKKTSTNSSSDFYYEGTFNYFHPITSYLYKMMYGCIISENKRGGKLYRMVSVADRAGLPSPSQADYAKILNFFDMQDYDDTFDIPHPGGKTRYFTKKIA